MANKSASELILDIAGELAGIDCCMRNPNGGCPCCDDDECRYQDAHEKLDAYAAALIRETRLECAKAECFDCGRDSPVEIHFDVYWHMDTKTDCNAHATHELLARDDGEKADG